MKFGSVCSGIEAASVAWHPLGWKAAWFAEIEPFPCAVLAHHYPEVPNLGDFTAIARAVLTGQVEAPDMLCGGTPCQAFSVAGLRESLADDRGNLTLKFVELADAIDHVRTRRGQPPAVVFWENVPGVLSTADNAFGCFLAGLAGEDEPLQPAGGKWSNAGAVFGPLRTVAWRILDAQYFGVAQRRRRVFVVASSRNGFDPCEVLFEWSGLRRDSAPQRPAGQGTAAGTIRSTDGGCDVDHARAQHVITMAHGQGGAEIGFDRGPTLTCNHEAPIAAYVPAVSSPLLAQGNSTGGDRPPGTTVDTIGTLVAFDTTQITSKANGSNPKPGDPCHPLAAGAHAPAIAFNHYRTDPTPGDLAPTLQVSKGSGVGGAAVAVPMVNMQGSKGNAVAQADGPSYTLNAMHGHDVHAVAVAVALRGRDGGATAELGDEVQNCLRASAGGGDKPHVLTAMQVRRLTPRECERLQGFPDDYTAIPWRGKPADQCPDGPRYKALGNSWAVPNVRWIGARIQAAIERAERKAA